MADMPWRDAVVAVLENSDSPMHYAEIAQAVIDQGYRVNVGATPAATVSATLSESVRKSPKRSPFVKVKRGVYALRGKLPSTPLDAEDSDAAQEDARQMGLINAFGMFWDRDQVLWTPQVPRLLGMQQAGSSSVNFTTQAGVYILYDRSRPIYVGRITAPRLGARLSEHTRDRLTGRWNRFSWFGVRTVRADGELGPLPEVGIGVDGLIATMEALLIEGLEPPQNRKQGDGFNAVEFIQALDPELRKEQDRRVLAQLTQNSGLA